ncbi:MAG: hypothetical protein RI967_2551 [Planctomycetota bacterium]|jgi:hypothetical protein
MKTTLASFVAVPALLLSSTLASADVTVPLKRFEAGRFEFAEAFRAGDLTGTLTGVSAFVTLDDTRYFTFAQDLAVYVVAGGLDQGVAQAGGFSPLVTDNYELWPDGESHLVGTVVDSRVDFAMPISMSAKSGHAVYIGNGYGRPDAFGAWTGYIVLHGVDEIGSTDTDGDGIADEVDNCLVTSNPAQEDCDGDGIGDACEESFADCNSNGMDDLCEVADATVDTNGDERIDACQIARGDLDLNGQVDGADILVILANWMAKNPTHPDPTGNNFFDGADLSVVLANWGPLD